MTEETGLIRALVADQDAAWCAGDATAFARGAAADIVFTNVVGRFSVGREPFEAQHRHIFATFYKGSVLQQMVERIGFVRPDVAIINTRTMVTGFGTLPPFLQAENGILTTRLEQLFVRTDDGWEIAAFHNVIVHPHGAAVAPPC